MSSVRDLLVRGSEKVMGHYRLLAASGKTQQEVEVYQCRVEREQRLLNELRDGFAKRFVA